MADAHFSRFQQIDAAEASILTELEDSSWGRLFSFQEIMVLAKHMTAYRLAPGGTLFKEGDRAPFLCLVYAGQVDVFKEDGEGDQKWLISIGKGKTLGEMSLIDKEPRSATCRAKMETDVLILDEEALATLSSSNPLVALSLVSNLAKEISRRLRKTTGTLLKNREAPDPVML